MQNLKEVYDREHDEHCSEHRETSVLNGYLPLTSNISFPEKSDDPQDDDEDIAGYMGFYSKRGQDPMITGGLLHNGSRYFDDFMSEK